MSQRVFTLSLYLFRSMALSLTGLLYVLFALVFYFVFFDPRQQTPDTDYYVLVLGLFGSLFAFLVTLSVAARANRAVHFPFLVRLPSRVEYMASVLLSSVAFTACVQLIVGSLAFLVNGPDFTFLQLLDIPPIWVAGITLFAVLALHATDLVTSGWSRVYVFGLLAVLLYLQSGASLLTNAISSLLNRLGAFLLEQGVNTLAEALVSLGSWLTTTGEEILRNFTGFIFWPFEAIAGASIAGHFTFAQALAPSVLLLYATVLFIMAADFFATKDIYLTE